ncbi:SDR family NAD(P)-dependent oxidoreductase [Pseudochryseolinea flava]|uniref:3-oxoacyl-ACP reductase n=1 Tax=Pseudochryseolinea flava TaxID=2059302 RepID=A0A364XXA9_9BACT|nr:SDR family oxidoreductase [Pseudochryseolinea flava]RAV99036.1 3-oxoacyl-ACP reductase [Pseudochryseolinea flava]
MNDKGTQKIAIVTGGASGLGFAIAQKLVCKKITTIIVGRNAQKLQEAKSQLGEFCHIRVADLTTLEAIPAWVEMIVNEFGKIDVLVNNAGINMKKPTTEVTDLEFQQIIQTNLTSVFTLSREVSKHMIRAGEGNIVNISSMAAHYGIPKVVAYTASKSAIEGMTRSLAVDLSPLGIRVNCVAPGFIETNMSAAALNSDPERKNRVLARTPMGKLGVPQDVANAVYFLTSDEASFITGAVLPVDGGNSIGF